MALSFLNLLSCVQLCYTIYQIKRIINNNKLLNQRNLTLHLLAGGITLFAQVFYVIVGYFTIEVTNHEICKVYYIASMFYGVCLFITQSMVSYIYWSLENTKEAVWQRMNDKREEIHTEEHHDQFMNSEEVEKVYKDDEEFSNYWNQFLNRDQERLADGSFYISKD